MRSDELTMIRGYMLVDNAEEEATHIRSVVANPDADEPRLRYAAWLDTQGRADRAELIRVQCQVEQLQAREKELLDAHSREWGQSLFGLGVDRWAFHRGFPEEIEIEARHLLNAHAKINALTPVRHINFGPMTDAEVGTLAALPVAPQLLTLTIGSPDGTRRPSDVGVEGVRALAASDGLSALRRLTVRSQNMGIEGAIAISRSPTLTNLTHLTLTDRAFNGRDDAGHRAIIASPTMANLERLQLGDGVLGVRSLRQLRQAFRADRPGGPGR